MPISDAALREVAKVLRNYVEPSALEQIMAELVEIRGDKEFRDTNREARARAADDLWPVTFKARAVEGRPQRCLG
jgi:hypothetical protein